MKKPINTPTVTIFQLDVEKSKRYVQLQNQGMSQMEATYRVFGSKIGDEMVRLHQHELILEEPVLN